jgi:hypothetical protein
MRSKITEAEMERDLQKIYRLSPAEYKRLCNISITEVRTLYIGLKAHINSEAYKMNQTDRVKTIDKTVLEFIEKYFESEIK